MNRRFLKPTGRTYVTLALVAGTLACIPALQASAQVVDYVSGHGHKKSEAKSYDAPSTPGAYQYVPGHAIDGHAIDGHAVDGHAIDGHVDASGKYIPYHYVPYHYVPYHYVPYHYVPGHYSHSR